MKVVLQDIVDKLSVGRYKNEEQVRFSLVGRILFELGWDIWNPEIVYTEFPVAKEEDNTKVDIAIFSKTKFPEIFIEIKALKKLDQNLGVIERQLRDYNRNNTAKFTVLTDGQKWRFYYAFAAGEFSSKCFRIIDLCAQDIDLVEDEFRLLLGKENIENGESEKIAKKYLDSSKKDRAIQDSLAEATSMMDVFPFPNKIEAIKLCVVNKGYSLDESEIMNYLENNSTGQPIRKPIPNISNEIDKNIPIEAFTGQKTKNFILRVTFSDIVFQEQIVKNTLIKLVEAIGIEKIKREFKNKGKFPLIIEKSQVGNYEKHKYSQAIKDKNYFILTHSNTETKEALILNIERQLRLGIKVEKIPF